MAARVGRIKIKRTVFDLWATKPSLRGNTRWETIVPFGLRLDWGLGGYIWVGWGWSGELCLYVDKYVR